MCVCVILEAVLRIVSSGGRNGFWVELNPGSEGGENGDFQGRMGRVVD
jgi:hypothetical protein